MKFKYLVAASLLAAAGIPAATQAQEAVELSAGTMVYGPEGNEVGTIESVNGDAVVLNTGNNIANLGRGSFVQGPNGPVIGFTKEKLDEVIEKAAADAAAKREAALSAALVPGAALRSYDGVAIGSIETIEEDGSIIVKQDETHKIALSRAQFSTDDAGLIVLFTKEQLDAALGN